MDILEILRMVFGGLFVLFVPGFIWGYVLFPGRNLNSLERVAISIGLSIAMVTLCVLIVNWLFDMKIILHNLSLTVCGLIVVPAVYILLRKFLRSKHASDKVK